MNMKKRYLLLIIALLGLGASAARAVVTACTMSVSNFQLNPSLIIDMYNVAQQNNNVITSYPANMNPGVLTMNITNNGTSSSVAYLKVTILDDQGTQIVSGCPIETKNPIAPGQTVSLNAASFVTGPSFSGTFNQNFANNQMKAIQNDPSQLQQLLNRHFTVCVYITDSACGSQCNSSCTQFTLMLGSPSGDSSVAILLSPHNFAVQGLPLFVWVPARKNGLSPSQISYRLQLFDSLDSQQPLAQVDVPGGNSSYQWKPSDYALKPGVKYYWRIVCLDPAGNPFGGPGNSGTNIRKWFWIQMGLNLLNSLDPDTRQALLNDIKPALDAALGGDGSSLLNNLDLGQMSWNGSGSLSDLLGQVNSGNVSVGSASLEK